MNWNLADAKKYTEHIKIILHPKFERKRILGSYFMALWFFNKVVWFVLTAMLESTLLPSNMAAQTTFCLYLVKRLIVTLRWAVNIKYKYKICVQKGVIHKY